MASVELRAIGKRFPGGVEALAGIDLKVADGSFLAVVGPSGSGKSTLLRLIAGLEAATAGSIRIGGREAEGLAPRDRGVGMVFQDPALYPFLTVFDNLAFGPLARRMSEREVRSRVEEMAGLLGLSEILGRFPEALSGGQRQRVALGRALAKRQGLLLLDEPLSNLDAPLRSSIRADLINLHRRLGTTTILVTHDQGEALAVGDRVAVLMDGRLAQVGSPSEVYDRPASRPVAAFLGSPPMAFLPGEAVAEGDALLFRIIGERPGTTFPIPRSVCNLRPGRVDLGLRAEHVRLAGSSEDGSRECPVVLASLRRLESSGHEVVATLALGAHILTMRLPPSHGLRAGEPIQVRLELPRASWFDSDGRSFT